MFMSRYTKQFIKCWTKERKNKHKHKHTQKAAMKQNAPIPHFWSLFLWESPCNWRVLTSVYTFDTIQLSNYHFLSRMHASVFNWNPLLMNFMLPTFGVTLITTGFDVLQLMLLDQPQSASGYWVTAIPEVIIFKISLVTLVSCLNMPSGRTNSDLNLAAEGFLICNWAETVM